MLQYKHLGDSIELDYDNFLYILIVYMRCWQSLKQRSLNSTRCLAVPAATPGKWIMLAPLILFACVDWSIVQAKRTRTNVKKIKNVFNCRLLLVVPEQITDREIRLWASLIVKYWRKAMNRLGNVFFRCQQQINGDTPTCKV